MPFRLPLVLLATLFIVTYSPADPPLQRLDAEVDAAVARGELPGAVVLVLHKGEVVHRKAYGNRALEPEAEANTVETIYDLASLTKPIATATSIFILLEQGKLTLDDPVAKYWPAFAANGKEKVTIEQCLLHTSGLMADNALSDFADGKDKALERIAALKLEAPPGTKFRYSDVGFIVLGHLVETLSTLPLDVFAKKNTFDPLAMKQTDFLRATGLVSLVAPTEKEGDLWLRGIVHDPRSRKMGGVAGHAGLFSNVDDLARFARMILNGGELDGKRILKPDTVRLMTEPCPVPGGLRTRGWDCATSFSSNRGTLFPKGKSFGHTGFTGTSIWLDSDSQTAVIFLSNRVHPNGKGNVTKLRGIVATLAAEAVGLKEDKEKGRQGDKETEGTRTGIDVLVKEKFARLKGKRVGLVTNHTGRDRFGRATIDLLHQAEGVKLVALFSPEHGIRGAVDQKVSDAKDEKTGLPIYSLYGQRVKPDAKSLAGIDVLVYDIQDIGCRFYTYISTLGHVMEAVGEQKIKLIVLDRPNPIGGVAVEGPILDAGRESFVAFHRLPVRHGMTVGELALLFNAERKLGVDLDIVKVSGWRRDQLFDRTGLDWINPSPNMRSLTAALLYPGIGLLETTNLSVGRGTERPFEWIGAPWLDGKKFAAALRARNIPGVRFVPVALTPSGSTHAGKLCGGLQIFVDDWSKLESVRLGLTIALELRRVYPTDWQVDRFDRLLGHMATWDAVKAGKSLEEIEIGWREERGKFRAVREKFLLYE